MRLLYVSVLLSWLATGCSSLVLEPIVKGGSSTWCESHSSAKTVYCRDFDDGRNYDLGWSSIYDDPNNLAVGTVNCGDHAADSAGCSLLVMTAQVPSDGTAQLQLQQKVESSSGVSLQFAFKIVDYDVGSPNVGLIAVYLQSTKEWWTSVDIVGSTIQLTECRNSSGDAGPAVCSSNNKDKGGPRVFDAWHQLRLQLITTGSTSTASLAYDDNVIIDPIPVTPPATPNQLLTQWGANYVKGPAKPMRLSYDNIKIDVL